MATRRNPGRKKRTKADETDRQVGAGLGGAILGGSIGGPLGAIIGGIVGLLIAEEVNKEKRQKN
jgi:gas vesicle protein